MSASSYESDRSDSGFSDESDDGKVGRTAECIRRVSNFATLKPFDLLDKPVFNPEYLALRMERAAPKLMELFARIKALDAQDVKNHGHLFKHMIFTDQRSSNYGAKVLASAFIARGYKPVFQVQGKGFHVLDGEELRGLGTENFGVLMSKPVFGRPLTVAYKRALLDTYNRRPENIHGDHMRFIILDQGFKEGIDLFDVKYIHLMEPLTIPADEKQAIGRGTRFCGQRGLQFHPVFGWPLYVFKYDVVIPDRPMVKGRPFTFHDLYLQYANLDLRKIAFAAEIEDATIEGAVDKDLTEAIHGFSIRQPSPILKPVATSGGATQASPKPEAKQAKPSEMVSGVIPPKTILKQAPMKAYIQSMFAKKFSYGNIELVNNCVSGGAKAKPAKPTKKPLPPGTIVQFTPTQDFVRHYFTPASPYKGMLLWHSVGTGKTCTAIATASSTFEPEGYTILWVTRHTLKSDIFKNLFRQVCSLVVQRKLLAGEMTLPASKKNLSERWIEPISYKQFTNLLTKKNKYYEMMVKRNGAEDPLRKTLLIIDEAHKLYSPGVAASEKPNTDILEQMIQDSYRISGADSVRMMVMTATPYTEDGMEMVKLLNLLRPEKQAFPTDFDDYANRYLDATGAYTAAGRKKWMDDISGYVSYLNRSKDARNFAYPVMEQVYVPMTGPLIKDDDRDEAKELPENGLAMRMKALKPQYKEAKAALKLAEKEAKNDIKEQIAECISKVNEEMQEAKAALDAAILYCNETHANAPKEKRGCIAEQKAAYKEQDAALKLKKKKCKDEPDDERYKETLADIQKQYEEIAEEYLAYKATYDELQAPRKENTAAMKELRPALKELREAYKLAYTRLSLIRKDAKRIKNILERKRRYEEIRRTRVPAVMAMKAEYLKVKEDMVRRLNENRVLRIRQGATTVGDITQAKVLEKKCLKNA